MLLNILHAIAAFSILIATVVGIHELGHLLVARFLRIGVSQFSLGMGPCLWKRTDRHGIEWRLSLLPIGGYVRFKNPTEPCNPRDRHLETAPPSVMIAIAAAGPIANVFLCIALLAGLAMAGSYQDQAPIVVEVMPDSPAATAGLKAGDEIVSANGQTIRRFSHIRYHLLQSNGAPVDLTVLRAAEKLSIAVQPHIQEWRDEFGALRKEASIGIRGPNIGEGLPLIAALKSAIADTAAFAAFIITALYDLVANTRVDNLAGPVTIGIAAGASAKIGFENFILLIAIISTNLAVINLLPIPGLDGWHITGNLGRILFRKGLPDALAQNVLRVGIAIIVGMMIIGLWNDMRPFF